MVLKFQNLPGFYRQAEHRTKHNLYRQNEILITPLKMTSSVTKRLTALSAHLETLLVDHVVPHARDTRVMAPELRPAGSARRVFILARFCTSYRIQKTCSCTHHSNSRHAYRSSDSGTLLYLQSPAFRYSAKRRLLYFSRVITAALCNRACHYIFVLWFLSIFISTIFLAYSQASQIGCLPYFHT